MKTMENLFTISDKEYKTLIKTNLAVDTICVSIKSDRTLIKKDVDVTFVIRKF